MEDNIIKKEKKQKVVFLLEESYISRIQKIADGGYEGNFSFVLRNIIKEWFNDLEVRSND